MLMVQVDSMVLCQYGRHPSAQVPRLKGLIMPRYFIDVRSHFATNEDLDGIELPDIAAAKAEALKVGAKLLENWAGATPSYSNAIVIEVIDEDLRPVLAIPYTEVALHSVSRT
jgi:hypothetical protein